MIIGDCSYSLYLWHVFAIFIGAGLLALIPGVSDYAHLADAPPWIQVSMQLLRTALISAFTALSYILLEKKLTGKLSKLLCQRQ